MKKNILFYILIFQFFIGQGIELETVKNVAVNFMNKKRPYIENNILEVFTETLNGETVLHIVNFIDGGWVIIPDSKSVVPILSFDLTGKYTLDGDKPEAFNSWIYNYKKQVMQINLLKLNNQAASQKWESLINDTLSVYLKSYTPGQSLLITDRGTIRWDQSKNNSGGCTPSYNAFCPTASCNCGRKLTGCGPVAMGQIMWYWEWPKKSDYRIYNWKFMPERLTNNSTTMEGIEVARLLDDCGDAANKNYIGCDTWTTVTNVESAFKNYFFYNAVDRRVRASWPGESWLDLMRAEINAERPVLYRGDKADLSGKKHIFVLTGYDVQDPDYFCFNFGWGNSYFSSWHYLNDITPGNSEYNANQMAVIGISPSYNEISNNIYDVAYSSVSNNKNEYAKNNISLPASSKSLNIENGGSLNFCAGNTITLKSGFYAKSGGTFEAFIQPTAQSNDCGISVMAWTNTWTNNELRYNVSNANTFEFEAFLSGSLVYQNAGTVSGNPVVVWDASGFSSATYTVRITFRNNCGEKISNSYNIIFIHN